MLLLWGILLCLIAGSIVYAEEAETTSLAFGEVLQLQCLQRDEDGEVR